MGQGLSQRNTVFAIFCCCRSVYLKVHHAVRFLLTTVVKSAYLSILSPLVMSNQSSHSLSLINKTFPPIKYSQHSV